MKSTQLTCQGWSSDLGLHMGPSENNSGFIERGNFFRIGFDQRNDFKPEGAVFFGRLLHDLVACETGLPPNTKVKIELERSPDSFVIMRMPDDVENYKLKILNISLFVPVAQLSAPVYQELNSIMTRKNDPQSISIHYRRSEVRNISLNKSKQEYNSDSIFTDSDLPCKIVICFVESENKNGSYATNPFELRRSWEVDETVTNDSQNEDALQREKMFEKRIHDMIEAKFNQFQKQFESNPRLKSKGRGKRLRQTSPDFADEVNKEAQRRLRSFLGTFSNRSTKIFIFFCLFMF